MNEKILNSKRLKNIFEKKSYRQIISKMKNYRTGEMHAGSIGRGTPDLWSQ